MAAYNKTKAPFNWTATADSILEKLQRLCSQISARHTRPPQESIGSGVSSRSLAPAATTFACSEPSLAVLSPGRCCFPASPWAVLSSPGTSNLSLLLEEVDDMAPAALRRLEARPKTA